MTTRQSSSCDIRTKKHKEKNGTERQYVGKKNAWMFGHLTAVTIPSFLKLWTDAIENYQKSLLTAAIGKCSTVTFDTFDSSHSVKLSCLTAVKNMNSSLDIPGVSQK